jgi:hypothetical protein
METTILCPEYPSEGIASNPRGYPCIICKLIPNKGTNTNTNKNEMPTKLHKPK